MSVMHNAGGRRRSACCRQSLRLVSQACRQSCAIQSDNFANGQVMGCCWRLSERQESYIKSCSGLLSKVVAKPGAHKGKKNRIPYLGLGGITGREGP